MTNESNEIQGLEDDINKKEHHGHRRREKQGAKTFRRGRAIAFYEKLIVRRDTLKKQLESEELQSIQQVIAGELKATEAIMDDFKAAFDLDEIPRGKHEGE